MSHSTPLDPESIRLVEDERRERNWKRFGPYLSERQWGTVREDYSPDGTCWDYFPHDHARSRVYRWGEDGLLGFCDRQARLCFALALWNERDPILKERLFGLTGQEGNHGEDVKELYYYLDSTPTHSYTRGLYKYPQAAYPYEALVAGNRARARTERELELLDTGVFAEQRYFDVEVEYAKASPDDVCIAVRVTNRGPARAAVHVLPTLWFRNTWSWGRNTEGYTGRPTMFERAPGVIEATHESLGTYLFFVDRGDDAPRLVFTDNETNHARVFGSPQVAGFYKDAFHRLLVNGEVDAVNPAQRGTKAAAHVRLELDSGATHVLRLRLTHAREDAHHPFADWGDVFAARRAEADRFYGERLRGMSAEEAAIARQAYAGLFWSKQFYYYDVRAWIEGDPAQPPPPPSRKSGRNREWAQHLYNRDIISMPDKWEYPWYASWDLAFHMIPLAKVDPHFAKEQLLLFLREWYMHPNGQIPAYEFAFSDVNPPVHAWSAWRVYKIAGDRDRQFLAKVFHKLLLNFTWWVNRKDTEGNNLFSGGFLGLDNIGVFDRSKPLPTGGHLEQADGTAWMAFYCATMLSIALELARYEPAYDEMASKFFEHFVGIADAMNTVGGTGLWDDADGFYYDQLAVHGESEPLRVRSMVGLLPLIAVEILEDRVIDRLPKFKQRMQWFLDNRPDLGVRVTSQGEGGHSLLAIASRPQLERVLQYLLSEDEFLSPFGIRSLSRVHAAKPYVLSHAGEEFRVDYVPGESTTGLFGGNSNWRGPIWFPVNYLLIEALERYDHFYGGQLTVELPTGSGRRVTLREAAREIARRLGRLFAHDGEKRPCHGDDRFHADAANRDLIHFYEYFDPETGRGLGASHQTGWTSLIIRLLEKYHAPDDQHG